MQWTKRAVTVAVAAVVIREFVCVAPPTLESSLEGRFAVVTGGGRGVGKGFVHGLTESGATVFATGRTASSVQETCASAPGPGRCIPMVVDSANDTALEDLFREVSRTTEGRLDILVNNAYAAVGHWRKHGLLGKPFWETGMGLYDAVHTVGVRSHYLATSLAVPLLRRAEGRGLVVNTNSAGCLLYVLSVPYGMGKCAIDKFTADSAFELATESIDAVSWWAKEPMQTEEVMEGALEGAVTRRGLLPVLGPLFEASGVRFDSLAHTALAGTVLWEGRVLSAFARDLDRSRFSGLAVRTSELASRYAILDERGLHSPSFLSVKFQTFSLIPALRQWATLPCEPGSACVCESSGLRFVFNTLPDVNIPTWAVKLLAGTPATIQWPGLVV